MGYEHSLKISAPQLLRFGIDSVLKILNERMTQLINELMNDGGVYRTAPATPGLLIKHVGPVDLKRFLNQPQHLIERNCCDV